MAKQLILPKTIENIKRIECKISNALLKFAAKYNLSLTEELYIRIIGRDDEYPAYAVYKQGEKIADLNIGNIIELNMLEKAFVSEESVEESIYRSLDKFLLGFEKEAKLSQLQIFIFTKTNDAKPLFYLYKDGKAHKQIQLYQIL